MCKIMKALILFIFILSLNCDLITDQEDWDIQCNYSYNYEDNIEIKTKSDIFYWVQENIEYTETVYVQTPEEIQKSGQGDCKAKVIMTAYLLYKYLSIDSEIIFCTDRGYDHLIMKYNDHYYNANGSFEIDDLIGKQYIIKDTLKYCEAIYEIQKHHRLYGR